LNETITKAAQDKNSREIKKAAKRFYKLLRMPVQPSPSVFRLMMFRMSRASMKEMLHEEYYDYRYYKEKGWFESSYYYNVSLSPIKKMMGWIFDFMGHQMSRQK
jgi:hypothetical protein